MIPEIKAKWVAALRSGEYAQGQQKLKHLGGTPTFCCLGVLCDILAPEAWEESSSHFGIHDGKEENPSPRIQEMAGIDAVSVTELIQMNDIQAKSFDQIADWIEATL